MVDHRIVHYGLYLYSCAGSEVCVGYHLQEHDSSFLLPLHSTGGVIQWRISTHQLCKLSDNVHNIIILS